MKFTRYLDYLITSKKYRLIDLAQRSGVGSSDLSKILHGKRACGAKAMEQILSGLDVGYRAQGLVFWLSDQVPASFAHLVHIVRNESDGSDAKDAPGIETIEGSLAVLAKQAEKNEALRAVLMNMAVAFTPSKDE